MLLARLHTYPRNFVNKPTAYSSKATAYRQSFITVARRSPRPQTPTALSTKRHFRPTALRAICHCHAPLDMSGAVSGSASAGHAEKAADYRLPTTVRPTHYDVAIKTDLQSNPPRYYGEALISLDVTSDVSELVFNAFDSLNITHIGITSSDLKTKSAVTFEPSALSRNKDTERGTLNLSSLPGGGLKAGSQGVKVFFRFESDLLNNMTGYYKSEGDLDESTGKKPIYALTQFEPTAARRAFPCWDEPLIKSKFTLTMIARDGETVLANMPETSSKAWKPTSNATVESALVDGYEMGSMVDASSSSGKTEGKTETSGNWKITKFETTPPVSTYLVAFACGEFASLHSEHHSKLTGKTVPLRIFATKDQIKQAQFGLDIKKWALPHYEEIFDVPYALPKLDTLVAHDFDAGAMENWGLITGRTTAYLYDPEKSSLAAKKRVANVQCHELAHMWFGDIVTMKWWDNLWLNESFATLMGEVIIPDRIWPEWKVRSEFINSHLTAALNLDSQRSSHPIEVDCPDANQINQIFDSISYSKGGSVLRMISAVVGEDKFLKGVSIYLKKHLFGNAETKDLWDGVSEASGLDVAKIMANWTLKVGFPVITVEEQGDGKIKLTQNRFLSTGDVKPEEDETLWWVPLEVKTLGGSNAEVDHKAVLSDRSTTYDLKGATDFKLNADTVGVYRVSYSPERLAKLGQKAHSFSVEDRIGLISDAATLARAGYAKTSGSLALIKELGKNETENLPWSQIGQAISKIVAAWWEQPQEVRDAITQLRRDLFRPIVDKMGYEHGPNDEPDVKELRELAVSNAAAADDPEVLAEIKKRFAPFLESNDDSQIPPDLQRTIYSTSVRKGGEKEWKKMIEVYNKPPNPSTKVDAMYSMCATEDPELLKKTFAMIGDGSVKNQDIYIYFFALGGNRKARRDIGAYFKQNYEDLVGKFGDTYGMSYLVKGSFSFLSSDKDLEETKAFFADKDVRKFRLAVSQSFDSIQAASDWLKRDTKDVEQWLKDNKYL